MAVQIGETLPVAASPGAGYDPELERIEIELLLEGIYRNYGFDFRSYAYASIRRRLWKRIEAEGLHTVSALQARVLHEPQLMEKLLRPYREELNITMELTSVVMIKRFVRDGFGVSLICAAFAEENVRRDEVHLLEIEGQKLWRQLALVYRKGRSLPLVASAFLELARKELAHGVTRTED